MYNLSESYLNVYNLDENVSGGRATRASFGGISQRTSSAEASRIRSAGHEAKLNKMSKEPSKGGVPRDSASLSKKRTPEKAAQDKKKSLPNVLPHMRKTPAQQRTGERNTNIRGALSDTRWGTRAANYDWRQQKRAERSKRLGLNKEDIEYILDYLVYEGYANSYDTACNICEHMSDDWILNILD
jgi:hypothetical protein